MAVVIFIRTDFVMELEAKISRIVKSWIEASNYSQSDIAGNLGITRAAFNGQLNCQRSIPSKHICKIVKLLKPPESELEKLNACLGEARSIIINPDGSTASAVSVEKAADGRVIVRDAYATKYQCPLDSIEAIIMNHPQILPEHRKPFEDEITA